MNVIHFSELILNFLKQFRIPSLLVLFSFRESCFIFARGAWKRSHFSLVSRIRSNFRDKKIGGQKGKVSDAAVPVEMGCHRVDGKKDISQMTMSHYSWSSPLR